MTEARRLKFTLECSFTQVDMVRAAIKGICAEHFDLDSDNLELLDFCLIVTELMNNAVEHARTPGMHAELSFNGSDAVFRLVTASTPFDPTRPASMPDIESTELPEGGFGLPLIQALADRIEYAFLDNENIVTLRKSLRQKTKE